MQTRASAQNKHFIYIFNKIVTLYFFLLFKYLGTEQIGFIPKNSFLVEKKIMLQIKLLVYLWQMKGMSH